MTVFDANPASVGPNPAWRDTPRRLRFHRFVAVRARRVEAVEIGVRRMFNDIDGYLTSVGFVSQIAALISALLSAIVGNFINGLFNPA